jgi:hypothetical protein
MVVRVRAATRILLLERTFVLIRDMQLHENYRQPGKRL